jgi:hypothetical protein
MGISAIILKVGRMGKGQQAAPINSASGCRNDGHAALCPSCPLPLLTTWVVGWLARVNIFITRNKTKTPLSYNYLTAKRPLTFYFYRGNIYLWFNVYSTLGYLKHGRMAHATIG